MPRRQFAHLSIDKLEKLFDEKRANKDVLSSLLAELSHRKMPRAKKLNRRVLQALSVAEKGERGNEPPDKSQALLTVEEHRVVAAHLRKGDPEWDDEERRVALAFAKHHEFLADLIEKRKK